MIQEQNSITINRPLEEVFSYVTDPENIPNYQKDVVAIKAPDKPAKVGTRYTETRKFMGRDLETTVEVTTFEPNKRFGLKAVDGPVPFEAEVTFERAGEGTKVTTKIKAEPGGFFKLAEGMVAKQLKQSLQEDDARLKSVLEGS
jgi:uncharacterized membrane protein